MILKLSQDGMYFMYLPHQNSLTSYNKIYNTNIVDICKRIHFNQEQIILHYQCRIIIC